MKAMDDAELAEWVEPFLSKIGVVGDERLVSICGLLKDRCDTLVALAKWISVFYIDVTPNSDELTLHVTDAIKPALAVLAEKLGACIWDKPSIATAIKETLAETGLKMPQIAMPVRVLVMGTAQTPSLDAVLALSQREKIIQRLKNV
jgi:glutamyl-tRNA synthetase